MRKLDRVLLLAAPTVRAAAYLAILAEAGLVPGRVLLLAPSPRPRSVGELTIRPDLPRSLLSRFDPSVGVRERVEMLGIPRIEAGAWNPCDPEVISLLEDTGEDTVISAAPGGSILSKEVFGKGKTFLHAHPGRLPGFRGSTPMHFQILVEGRVEVSVIRLSPGLDSGDLISMVPFPLPDHPEWIDYYHDPLYRAEAMAGVLPDYLDGKITPIPQDGSRAEMYRVIHPVLRNLAVFKAMKGDA